MTVYDWVFRKVISHVDAELAHKWSFQTLRIVASIRAGERLVSRICSVPALPVRAMGLRFPNPLGLAAGFDKDAAGIDGLAALGFGFIEVGTVTARPQPGNPRPRLFRLAQDQAIVNRMGFNNAGAVAAAERLRRRKSRPGTGRPTIVGVNIGKTRSTPVEHAIDDYIVSTRLLAPHADYLVVNVSSPNTPGLRDLQAVDRLGPLLDAVRHAAVQVTQRRVPLLVKISPDLDDDDIGDIAGLALDVGLDGIIATNTTTRRDGLRSARNVVQRVGPGGLSGAPLKERSVAVLRLLRRHVGDSLTLVSVGGIESAEDVLERKHAGATLVQAYTGLVYGGPLWPSRTLRRLAAERDGGHR